MSHRFLSSSYHLGIFTSCLALPRAWITLSPGSCGEVISLSSPYKISRCLLEQTFINTRPGTQTALAWDASKNPSVVQSRGFICLIWGKFLPSRNEFSAQTCAQERPQRWRGGFTLSRQGAAEPSSTLFCFINYYPLLGPFRRTRGKQKRRRRST